MVTTLRHFGALGVTSALASALERGHTAVMRELLAPLPPTDVHFPIHIPELAQEARATLSFPSPGSPAAYARAQLDGVSLLGRAVALGNAEAMAVLRDHGAGEGEDAFDLLLVPCAEGKVEVVRQLLQPRGAQPGLSPSAQAVSAFEFTPGGGRGKKAETLKFAKGTSLLMVAAWFGHVGVVELLLASGADVKARDCEGETAAQYASAGGQAACMGALQGVGESL
jgi:hypothetical protein